MTTTGQRTPRRTATLGGHRMRITARSMPTVLIVEGFRFFFFVSNEGLEPPHIHVERGDGLAKFWLQPVELAVVLRLKQHEVRRARLLVETHQTLFLEKWNEYFGT
jgi:Domain of unknown function (DUF4160)